MITILNYGMGNLGSLLNMFKRIGVEACIESEPSIIAKADKLILPGVGSFDAAMSRINNTPGLREVLDKKALVDRVPVLGVCLGMQLLTRSSEEGKIEGLGWISAKTTRFPKNVDLKVPHMGWNVAKSQDRCSLTDGLEFEPRYYFVHSYCVHVDKQENTAMKTYYGIEFDSAICSENIFGVQFHPEKSHRYGMHILKNFSTI